MGEEMVGMIRKITPGNNLAVRIGFFVLGAAFVLWGLGSLTLGVFGTETTGVITHIRREGGERADGRPGRYTYILSYSFSIGEDRLESSTRRIGDSVYLKVREPGSPIGVRYFAPLPLINSLAEDTKPNLGHLVLVMTGGFLVYISPKLTKNKLREKLKQYP